MLEVSNIWFNFANRTKRRPKHPFQALIHSKRDKMKDRIKKLMEDQHMTQKVFAQMTGISEGSLSGIFNGRTKPTLSIVDSIHQHLPKVSVYWLLYGDGPMYVDDQPKAGGGSATAPSSTAAPQSEASMGSAANGYAPTLFDAPRPASSQGVQSTINNQPQTVIKYVDKPTRQITEIRVFYDDQTWETFVPKK